MILERHFSSDLNSAVISGEWKYKLECAAQQQLSHNFNSWIIMLEGQMFCMRRKLWRARVYKNVLAFATGQQVTNAKHFCTTWPTANVCMVISKTKGEALCLLNPTMNSCTLIKVSRNKLQYHHVDLGIKTWNFSLCSNNCTQFLSETPWCTKPQVDKRHLRFWFQKCSPFARRLWNVMCSWVPKQMSILCPRLFNMHIGNPEQNWWHLHACWSLQACLCGHQYVNMF